MPKRSEKNHRLILALTLILFVLFLSAFAREYIGNRQVRMYIEDLQEQKEKQESVQLETTRLISQLSSKTFVETQGRTKQGLGAQGETMIVIQDNDEEISSDMEKHDGITNVARWFYYFFSKETFETLGAYED